MSRMRTKAPTPARVAKDLAQAARDLGGDDATTLAVYRRFVERDLDCLPPTGSNTAVLAAGHLWELLQRELDAGHRLGRGMFFTPRPLVQFMVRSVVRLLKRIDSQDRLHVIDPACGYGGFLIEVGIHIPGANLTGIEICPTTCAVARLLTTRELIDRQPALINANPLLAGQSLREIILGTIESPLIPVILGNPPWSNFGRENRGPWIDGLLADYRAGLNERKTNLADDAIKFIRWAQYWVEQAGVGIVALVTPNTWLSGLTHRRMRQSLQETFDEIFVLDLHGETGEETDENVFGVRSGVAIALLLRLDERGRERPSGRCEVASLRGSLAEKFAALDGHDFFSFGTTSIRLSPPHWQLALPHSSRGQSSLSAAEYASFWSLDRIFRQYTSGVQTKQDAVFVGFTREELAEQVQAWLAQQRDPPQFDAHMVQPYLLAPFDRRFVYYDPRLIGRARQRVMRHMREPNLGLVFMRQSTNRGEYDHFLAVDCLVSDRVFYSRHGAPFLAPLWTYKAPTGGRGEGGSGFGVQGSEVEANFDPDFIQEVAAAIDETPDPTGLFQYLYAVAYWPRYRERFGEELRQGFPRFPLPVDGESFRGLSALGGQLVGLHAGCRCPESLEASLPPAVDEGEGFRIGGYDVLRRWAKPRLGRGRSAEDERELARLAWIGLETRRQMREIENQSPDQWSG